MADDDNSADDDFDADEVEVEHEDEDFSDEPVELDDVDDVDDADEAGFDDDFTEEDEGLEVAEVEAEPAPKATATKTRRARDDDEEEDDDEVVDPDDVEADLDAILKDRIAAQPDEEEDEDDEVVEPDDRGDGTGRIQPKKADEFLCQSCFLVKHRRQLADEDMMLCVDCV